MSAPEDIDPISGCRLSLPSRGELDATARAAYDRLADPNTESLVGLRGPGGIRLHAPTIATHTQALTGYFRDGSILSPAVREVAILATAREHDSQFEWAAHEPAARRVGVGESVIECIRHRRPSNGLSTVDRTVIEIARELFGAHRLSATLYREAVAEFGPRGLVDLVSLMAMYAGTAALLAAFDMQLPEGEKPGLPLE